jgi:hypothetical protein
MYTLLPLYSYSCISAGGFRKGNFLMLSIFAWTQAGMEDVSLVFITEAESLEITLVSAMDEEVVRLQAKHVVHRIRIKKAFISNAN